MLSVVAQGRSLAVSAAWVRIASIALAAKQVLGAMFTFFHKSKILFGFLSVRVNRY